MVKKLLVCSLILVFFPCLTQAGNPSYEAEAIKDLFIDTPTLSRGYTVVSPDGGFQLGIRPEVLAVETRVVIKQYDNSKFEFPEGYEPITQVYEFDIFNKNAFQNEKPLLMKFYAQEPTTEKKRIFFYNGTIDEWVELPSYADGEEMIKSIIHLPYARLVILKDMNTLEYGQASWYAYKNCNCAASPDYPKGTLLKVTNLENDKSVVVTVNDYGPDRSIFPDRIIDLDKVAFGQIGELWQGVLSDVKVEPY